MSPERNVRWIQRFSNYRKALYQLEKFIQKEDLTNMEEQGLIKRFEYTYELSWNVVKDFYQDQGETGIQGSKDAFRMAFSRGLIKNPEVWMEMIETRKLTVHTYDDVFAENTARLIKGKFWPEFVQLRKTLENIAGNSQATIGS